MGSPDWNVSVVDIHLRKFLWVYCPGHAGVKGNNRADKLAGKATLTSGLLHGWSEVLRSLRHYLRAQSQGHHTIDHLEERGEEAPDDLLWKDRSALSFWFVQIAVTHSHTLTHAHAHTHTQIHYTSRKRKSPGPATSFSYNWVSLSEQLLIRKVDKQQNAHPPPPPSSSVTTKCFYLSEERKLTQIVLNH